MRAAFSAGPSQVRPFLPYRREALPTLPPHLPFTKPSLAKGPSGLPGASPRAVQGPPRAEGAPHAPGGWAFEPIQMQPPDAALLCSGPSSGATCIPGTF